MISKNKNKIFFSIFFIFFFLFGCYLYNNNEVISYRYEMPKNSFEYEVKDIINLSGIEKNENYFTVNEKDAYFMINVDKQIKSISFDLNTEEKNFIKVYYSDTTAFSEIETLSQEWKNNETITLNIDTENIKNFMIKVEKDFKINSIFLSQEKVVKIENKRMVRNDLVFLVFNVCISFLLTYCIVCKYGQRGLIKLKNITKDNIFSFFIKMLFFLSSLLFIIVIQLLFTKGLLINNAGQYVINYYRVIFSIGINTLFWGIVWLRKCFKENKIEKIFLLVCLSIGIPFSISLPMLQESTWDAGIHYGNTIEITYFNSEQVTELDKNVGWLQYSYNIGELNRINKKYNSLYENSDLVKTKDINFIGYYNKIGYLPLATGIFVARGLNMSFTQSITIGKIFNVVFYAILIYFAIKRIKKGKLLIFVLSLFPTVVMLASTYSYDGWVFAWMTLGLSYLFANFQEKDQFLSLKEAIIIGGSLFISLGPKAIYFPIMILCWFLPKEKFSSKKNKYYFNAFIGILMLSSLATFILPFIFGVSNGTVVGDSRGGNDVNSIQQVKYILTNPVQYTKTLLSFLKGYWGISNTYYYTTFLAYIPNTGKLTSILLLNLLGVLVIGEEKLITTKEMIMKKEIIIKIIWLLIVFGISCLIASALYVSFTPVGLDGIAGCQPRYLLPILFPVLYCLYNVYKPVKINRTVVNWVICSISMFILVYNVLVQVVLLYWI